MVRKNLKRDVIPVLCVIAVVLAAACAVELYQSTHVAGIARVHDAEGTTHDLPLDENTEYMVTTELGSNLVVVEDGHAFVSEADCPNHDCVNQGAIDEVGEQIVCLPHQLYVEIVEASGQNDERSDEQETDDRESRQESVNGDSLSNENQNFDTLGR